MVDFLDPSVQTIAKQLKANGYATAHFGKWHMGGGRDVVVPLPQAYGFDESLVFFEGMGDRILFTDHRLSEQSAQLEIEKLPPLKNGKLRAYTWIDRLYQSKQ